MKQVPIVFFLIIWCFYQNDSNLTGQNLSKLSGNQSYKNNSLTMIDGSIGIIKTTPKYKFGDTITIFTKKRQISSNVVITYEYQMLALKCLLIEKEYYKIRLEDNSEGYLLRSDSLIKFQTWDEHVLSVFAVGFDIKNNPLKESPNDQSDVIVYEKDEFYFPVKLQDDWLQVKWGNEEHWQYGWIKWKRNGLLLIELYYFA